MITINLTPIEELEDPRWWIPDVGAFLLIVGITLGAVYFYIGSLEDEVDLRRAEKQRLIDETSRLEGDVSTFNDLNSKISALNSKKNSLQRITESKLVRYLPIILLENIQNLKPEGVWFKSVSFVEKKGAEGELGAAQPPTPPPPVGNSGAPGDPGQGAPPFPATQDRMNYPLTLEITGNARDNVRIAEFMMALKATQNQSFERSDLRTQLFFSEVGISFSQVSVEKLPGDPGDLNSTVENSEEEVSTVSFKLDLNFRERNEGAKDSNSNFSQFIEDFKRDGQATMN